MELVGFPIQVIDDAGNGVDTASVEIRRRPSLALASVYEDDSTSPTTMDNPAETDASGFLQTFLDVGKYRIVASWMVGITVFTRTWYLDIAPGVPAGSLTPQGDWDGSTPFAARDLVSHADGGETYLFVSMVADNQGNEPDAATPGNTAFWQYVGVLGADGQDGTDPGKLMTFDGSATADADPGSGKVRANNADLSAATLLFFSKTSRGGSDLEAWLLGLADSTSNPKGEMNVVRPSDEAQVSWNVTGVTDASGYVKVAIATASHAGETSLTDLDDISVQFTPKGDAGATGASGASALTIVRLAATGNVALASELENGDTIDGVVVATGDVVLLPAQTAPAENGVYVVPASGAASRHTDFDGYDDLPGAYFSVMEGTANADTLWRCTSDRGGTIDSTALAIAQYRHALLESFVVACSDEITALTAGTAKVKFRMPYAFTLTAVRASLSTAQTSGSILTVDINEGGSSILSTELTIDNGEKTSTTAAASAVISDTSLADDAEMSFDIDQVGDGTAKGLKVTLVGYRT